MDEKMNKSREKWIKVEKIDEKSKEIEKKWNKRKWKKKHSLERVDLSDT